MKLLLDHFEELTHRPELAGKLKELILQLAMQGKLVPQDLNDEPASELLKRIQTEKQLLVDAGEIKKGKSSSNIKKDEIPFDIPSGWVWARWNSISHWITYGFTRPMPHIEEGIPIITAKNVNNDKLDFSNTNKTTLEAFQALSKKDIPQIGDILLTKDGSIGRAAIVITNTPFCISQSVAVIWLKSITINRKYLLYVINSKLTQNYIREKSAGVAVPHISITYFKKLLLPLPPLNEQKRIVAKVQTLLEKVDAIVACAEKTQQTRIHLSSAALHQLSNGVSPEEFRQNWQRIASNFPQLFSDLENVKTLRQTILQLAVQGKLVPQDPNDEPATELLKRIQTEKQLLVDTGEIKKEKSLPTIEKDNYLFNLPNHWTFCRMLDVG